MSSGQIASVRRRNSKCVFSGCGSLDTVCIGVDIRAYADNAAHVRKLHSYAEHILIAERRQLLALEFGQSVLAVMRVGHGEILVAHCVEVAFGALSDILAEICGKVLLKWGHSFGFAARHQLVKVVINVEPVNAALLEMRLNEQIRAIQLVESVLVFDELGLSRRIVNDLALGEVRAGERYLACREERLRV